MKVINLLGQPVEIELVHGTVLDASSSHKTHVSGGGSMHYGRGAPVNAIHTQISTETKVFLETPSGERSFVLAGDYDLRPGHDVVVVLARRGGRSLAIGLSNHSLSRTRYRLGSSVAQDLGIAVANPKWRDALQMLVVQLVAVALGAAMVGHISGGVLAMIPATAAYYLWTVLRRRRRSRQADTALDAALTPLIA